MEFYMTNLDSAQQEVALTIDHAFQQAIAHHQAGQLQQAEQFYLAILQTYPDHPDANHNIGILAMQVNQPARALQHLKVALDANPNKGQYWRSYIDALIQTGQINEARNMLALGLQKGLQGKEVELLVNRLGNPSGNSPIHHSLNPASCGAGASIHDNPLIEYLENNNNGRVVNRWRHYFDIYHRHFARFRGQRLTMIEIGVFNGGSLLMWRDYLGPQATIVGVDINPGCEKFSAPGIDIVIGDQADRMFLRSLSDRYPDVAILLDDGGHQMHQQIATFEELYPRLRSDGVYLCEDIHTSYMSSFGGGYRQTQTFIETVKPLIDRLNAFHSRDHSQFAPDDFTCTTDSMHFYDSVLVIEKKPRMQPEEVVYGSIADFRYVAPSISGV
jgi:tetratricopeptide (TPR) repeat protein